MTLTPRVGAGVARAALLPTGSNGQPWWDDAWRQDEARMAREKALARLPYLRVYRLSEALLSPIQMSRFPESS